MLSKTIKTILSGSKLPLTFIGGVAFGTLGLKVLASKEAKKFYVGIDFVQPFVVHD